jgi:hypothetical protein
MRWSVFARIGQGFARLRRRRPPPLRHEIVVEFSTEELAEFLASDVHPSGARPEFRDRLREDLWALVQETQAAKPGSHN